MSYTGRTISYFLTWGIFYGVLLGGLTGTALIPFYGTGVGSALGFMAGIYGGIMASLAAIVFKAAQFDFDTNLDLHRRKIARQIGASFTLILLLLWLLGIVSNPGLLGSGALVLLMLPFGSLAAAYTAHRYPDVIAKRMFKDKHGLFVGYERDPARPTIYPAIIRLWERSHRYVILVLGAAVGFFIRLSGISVSPYRPSVNYTDLLAYAGIGAILAGLLWIYIAISNGILLTFIKRLVLQDYFPHLSQKRYHDIITGTAFFFTLITTWWTLILAPFIAGLTAYYVYDTLALRDETIEKAKRKEKNALALPDETDDEDEDDMLIDDELMQEREQR